MNKVLRGATSLTLAALMTGGVANVPVFADDEQPATTPATTEDTENFANPVNQALATLKANVTNAQKKLDAANKTLSDYNSEKATVNSKIATAEADVKAKTDEVTAAKKTLTDYLNTVKKTDTYTKDTAKDTLKSDVNGLENDENFGSAYSTAKEYYDAYDKAANNLSKAGTDPVYTTTDADGENKKTYNLNELKNYAYTKGYANDPTKVGDKVKDTVDKYNKDIEDAQKEVNDAQTQYDAVAKIWANGAAEANDVQAQKDAAAAKKEADADYASKQELTKGAEKDKKAADKAVEEAQAKFDAEVRKYGDEKYPDSDSENKGKYKAGTVEDAAEALKTAQDKQTAANTKLEAAQKAEATAKSTAEEKKTALDTANANLDQYKDSDSKSLAKAALAEAKSAKEKADSELAEAKVTASNADKAYNDEATANAKEGSTVYNLKKKVDEKTKAYNEAFAKDPTGTDAATALSEKRSAEDALYDNEDWKKEAKLQADLATANKDLADKQSTADTAKAAVDAAQAVLDALNGKTVVEKNGLVLDADGKAFHYYKDGSVDKDYYGFVDYNGGKFLVKDGTVDTDVTGTLVDPQDGTKAYFLSGGQVQTQYTGLAEYNGEWFVVKDGNFVMDYNGLYEFNGQQLYIAVGQYKRNFSGLTTADGTNWVLLTNGILDEGFSGNYTWKTSEGSRVVKIESGKLVG